MFCTSCGTPHATEAASFCYNCGLSLSRGAANPLSLRRPSLASQPRRKNPVVAAFLNLFFGAGYLYLGYRSVLGIPAPLFVILSMVAYLVLGAFSDGLADLLFAVIFAIDGWQKGAATDDLGRASSGFPRISYPAPVRSAGPER